MKKLRVTVDGKAYDVLVEILDQDSASPAAKSHAAFTPVGSASIVSATVTPPQSSPSAPQGVAAAAGEVPSPLAGKVVSIDVQVGQKVEANAQLLTLEAMKMNTYVFAHAAGTVAAILVKVGDGVEEGQGLMRLS